MVIQDHKNRLRILAAIFLGQISPNLNVKYYDEGDDALIECMSV
jgi:hypothetical protein